jgi:hypothetical protein
MSTNTIETNSSKDFDKIALTAACKGVIDNNEETWKSFCTGGGGISKLTTLVMEQKHCDYDTAHVVYKLQKLRDEYKYNQ